MQAHATGNQFGNSKYCLNSMDLQKSNLKEAGAKAKRKAAKQAVAQAKTYEQLAEGIGVELLADKDRADWQARLLQLCL